MVFKMRNGSSSPPIASISTGYPIAFSHNPILPSKGSNGPVIPSAASCAAKTPERVAAAAAQPFHIDSSPIRVTRSGTLGTTASEIA